MSVCVQEKCLHEWETESTLNMSPDRWVCVCVLGLSATCMFALVYRFLVYSKWLYYENRLVPVRYCQWIHGWVMAFSKQQWVREPWGWQKYRNCIKKMNSYPCHVAVGWDLKAAKVGINMSDNWRTFKRSARIYHFLLRIKLSFILTINLILAKAWCACLI